MLELGIKAPDFELPDQNGEVHKLSDYLGKKIILYFFSRTFGCGCFDPAVRNTAVPIPQQMG